jgi:hypothetical protein
MIRHVRSRDCVARRAGNLSGRSVGRASRRRVGRDGRRPRLTDGRVTARPRTSYLDRAAWPMILWVLDGE